MRLSLVAVAILLAATAVSAQIRSNKKESPSALVACDGCAHQNIPYYVNGAPATATTPEGRRKLAGVTSKPRKLLGNDGTPTVTSQLQLLTKLCPASGGVAYTDLVDSAGEKTMGQLVHDNGVCVTSAGRGSVVTVSNTSGAIYGGAAQDFGGSKTTWETYGWSLFKLSNTGLDADITTAWIQGINLHLIGAIGTGHDGSACSVTGVSFGVYSSDQTTPFNISSSTAVYQKNILFSGGANINTWSWSTNQTVNFYTDIFNIYDDAVDARGFKLNVNQYYWLRVKVFATPYANSPNKRCFVYWGMSSTAGNGLVTAGSQVGRAKWQEAAGGATGYSTTCTGATTSPTAFPGQWQSFYNCWNNGVNTNLATPTYRRCATFRQSTVPPLVAADCQAAAAGAQFNDFNFALTGFQGQPGDGAVP